MCCEVSTIGIVYSPICCGCFICTDLASGEISILKSFLWVLAGSFSSSTNLFLPCSWTWQPSLEWFQGRVAYRAASALSLRMNRHLEMEGKCQRSTLTQRTQADRVLAYGMNFSNKKCSKNPICTLEMPEFQVPNKKVLELFRKEGGEGRNEWWLLTCQIGEAQLQGQKGKEQPFRSKCTPFPSYAIKH